MPACLRQPQLFYQSPETIENHLRANMFIKKNRYKNLSSAEIIEKILNSPSCLSKKNETNYAPLLRTKMFSWGNTPKPTTGISQVNQKLINYLKENPNSKFSFNIIDDLMSTDFIEYAKNLGIVAVGRDDVFDIKIAP